MSVVQVPEAMRIAGASMRSFASAVKAQVQEPGAHGFGDLFSPRRVRGALLDAP